MSKTHFIPHALVSCVSKEMEIFLQDQKQESETISHYIKHSSNPRWAASHLVRAIAQGLESGEEAMALFQVANKLSETIRGSGT